MKLISSCEAEAYRRVKNKPAANKYKHSIYQLNFHF